MLIYKIDRYNYRNDYPPKGSLYSEGRWSKTDMWVVYCSESIALAKLETLANSRTFPKGRVLRTLELKDDAPLMLFDVKDLPENWSEIPYPDELAELIRDVISKKEYVGALVPSAQSFKEYNILLFPDHPDFNTYVRDVGSEKAYFDKRLK